MVTGEDYQVSPLSISQEIIKTKSVNRTSSGISRYYDLLDSTGKYSSTNLYGADGIIYKDKFTEKTSPFKGEMYAQFSNNRYPFTYLGYRTP